MRYFLDTEYNGWTGALISLALVPDQGEELYLTIETDCAIEPWVARNVMPYLDTVPDALRGPRLNRADAAQALAYYLAEAAEPQIVADWPEDIALFNMLLVTGAGTAVAVPPLTFLLRPMIGFSPARNSVVPHNALHDARALRDHYLEME